MRRSATIAARTAPRGERPAEQIELVDLPPDQAYPVLDDDTGVFWYRPDHINRHLGLTVPPLQKNMPIACVSGGAPWLARSSSPLEPN